MKLIQISLIVTFIAWGYAWHEIGQRSVTCPTCMCAREHIECPKLDENGCLPGGPHCPGVLQLGIANEANPEKGIADGDYVPLTVDAQGCLMCCEDEKALLKCGYEIKKGMMVCASDTWMPTDSINVAPDGSIYAVDRPAIEVKK